MLAATMGVLALSSTAPATTVSGELPAAVFAVGGLLEGGASDEAEAGLIEESELPSWFAEELFDPAFSQAVRMDETETLFGFESEEDSAWQLAAIAAEMEGHGWLMQPTGIAGCATFVREKGEVRWASINCIDVGGATAVVVQTA